MLQEKLLNSRICFCSSLCLIVEKELLAGVEGVEGCLVGRATVDGVAVQAVVDKVVGLKPGQLATDRMD